MGLRCRSLLSTVSNSSSTKRLSSFEVGAYSDQMPSGRLLFYFPHVASDQVEIKLKRPPNVRQIFVTFPER